jgi:hypothetical protein
MHDAGEASSVTRHVFCLIAQKLTKFSKLRKFGPNDIASFLPFREILSLSIAGKQKRPLESLIPAAFLYMVTLTYNTGFVGLVAVSEIVFLNILAPSPVSLR